MNTTTRNYETKNETTKSNWHVQLKYADHEQTVEISKPAAHSEINHNVCQLIIHPWKPH